MAVQLIITDLDGTVYDEDNRIPVSVAATFRQARALGVPAVIATGRTETESREAASLLGADQYIITMNGAFIYDYQRQQPL